jgi:formylglycine-generating enzyme required for sulfatase activity
VTTARYRKFLKKARRTPPEFWKEIRPGEDDNRPVVGMDWFDAGKYCGWAGKRLPTKEEWEKAARGTDGRKYPWGNEEPTKDRASYNWDSKRSWTGYGTLSPVGSYEPGKSPYGIYDLIGNVSEWTSSEEGGGKVRRGGSWKSYSYNLLPSLADQASAANIYNDIGFRCARDTQ